jgi:hypothetical protein
MATYINNNVKFHAFSKSPVSPDTTLGGAVNPSGHTITTSQVRAQDIPAFLNTFAGSRGDAITWLGKNYATPAHNDIAYYGGEFKAGFDTPKCLKYNGKTSTWEDFDLKYTDRANNVLRTTLKNADDKDVLAIHQDCTTVFVDGGNNAATNSNRWSLFVKKADGSILDHFVASTDKIVAGMPSLGYNALVMLNNAAIDEGELDANYVGNTFAGIIHLNKQYANGDDAKFKVTCFEYIGDKLDTTLGNIREEIQDIVGVTMEGVVASVGTNDDATNAGIGVDSTTKTSPKITFTAGSVATGETKLVSGGAVKTYVDTTALAEGGSIAKAIADYVATNAKVSVNGQAATTITVAGTAQSSSDLVKVVVTEDKDTENEIGLTLTATADVATVTSGAITSGHEGKLVKAGDAKSIVDKAIDALSATGGAIATLTTRVGEAEANAAASASAAAASQTAAEGAKSEAAASKTASEAAQSAAESAQSAAEAAASDASTSAQAATAAQTAAEGSATSASQSASAASASAQSAAESEAAAVQAAADAKAAKEFVETTAKWEAGSDDTLGNFTSTTASGVVTGTTVKTVADEVLTLAKSYSDSLHTTSLDYVVLGDSESLPTASADTLGKIYLVASQNAPTSDGAAISGSYVEYMTRKVGEGETATYTWEKIGTTAADLSGYAKSVTINGQTYTASASNAGALDLGTVVTSIEQATAAAPEENLGTVHAHIQSGALYLGIASATSDKMGVSKMFTGDLSTTASTVTDTAVSVKSAQAMYSSLATQISGKADANNVVNSINGIKGAVNICVHNGVAD